MMRKTPAASMQKTYDECYLTCSTAIYFEGQNNEAEALRAWRNALDQIYYHNAYKLPSAYTPRSGTEKALHDSLRSMELQCKERVDLLEALRKSRKEAEEEAKGSSKESLSDASSRSKASAGASSGSWLGQNTVPQTTYADIPKPKPPPQPARPAARLTRPSNTRKASSDHKEVQRSRSDQAGIASNSRSTPSGSLQPPPSSEQSRGGSRTPSPEKKGGMLRTLRSNPKDRSMSARAVDSRNRAVPAAAKAATQSWSTQAQRNSIGSAEQIGGTNGGINPAATYWDPYTRTLIEPPVRPSAPESPIERRASANAVVRPPSPSDYMANNGYGYNAQQNNVYQPSQPMQPAPNPYGHTSYTRSAESVETARPPPVPSHSSPQPSSNPYAPPSPRPSAPSLPQMPQTSLSYMQEYPNHLPSTKAPPPRVPYKKPRPALPLDRSARPTAPPKTIPARQSPSVPHRKAVNTRAAGVASATIERQKLDSVHNDLTDRVGDLSLGDHPGSSSSPEPVPRRTAKRKPAPGAGIHAPSRKDTPPSTDDSPEDDDQNIPQTEAEIFEARAKKLMKNLPKGVDEGAAKQIFNEIVIKGDQVHWSDVAGLEIAKSALKETVVYPFLRPDLFMGLREPARGMLLFGPPGTGKTMLARAVATESKSVFFAISASSLTSKYLGESEKLVRALFTLAKSLAPSIIFVDEIDSLLGARGGGSEHEATRRIKTEFLIQWSDLQKAAAGREDAGGDATRVLVLAATNLPWAIDEAARRRFVRRQYIPLPEGWVREEQLRTLLAAQKHSMTVEDLEELVGLTDGFSGSDITALAKDAAMGPLRSLGEKLLHMSPDEIRPICFDDFRASLVNIRPSVSKAGLKEFEDWSREFGERGG